MKVSEQIKGSTTPTTKRQAADELPIDQIPPEKIKLLHTAFPGAHVKQAWEGVHGYILDFTLSGATQAGRMTKDHLAKLVKDPHFRWIEFSARNNASMGC